MTIEQVKENYKNGLTGYLTTLENSLSLGYNFVMLKDKNGKRTPVWFKR